MTDSAAAATAFSTGVKTFNGAVGVDVDGNPVPTLLEDARRAGKATGLVTTSQVTDATPAAYGAHVTDRAQQSEIARQFLEGSKPDVILGGGEDFWYPPGNPGAWPDNPPTDPTEQSKGDRGNLVDRAQRARLRVRERPRGPARTRAAASCSACSPTRRCSSTARRATATSTSPSVPLPEMAAKALDIALPRPGRLLRPDRGGGDRRDGPREQRRPDDQVGRRARRDRASSRSTSRAATRAR